MPASRPKRIAIIKLSAIGDVLHGVPTAVAIRRHFPDAEIAWVVEGRSGDVLEGHPAIDRLIRIPRGWLASPSQVARLRRGLLEFRPEVAIDLQGLAKSGVAAWLSGARTRIGHAPPEARECSWIFSTHRITARQTHVVDRNLELLSPLGIENPDVAFEMPCHTRAREAVEAWWRAMPLPDAPAVLNPGAGWTSKIWPAERFAAVARRLSQQHGIVSLVVWGGNAERLAAEQIVRESQGAAVMAPPTSLAELAEVARLGRLFISSDTGPLHLAAAVGTPCVGLLGPVPAARNGPYGPGHVSVEPPPGIRPDWKDRKTDTRSMLAIDPNRVVEAAAALLARTAAA